MGLERTGSDETWTVERGRSGEWRGKEQMWNGGTRTGVDGRARNGVAGGTRNRCEHMNGELVE